MLTENRVVTTELKRQRLVLIKERHRMLFLNMHEEFDTELIRHSNEDGAFDEELDFPAG